MDIKGVIDEKEVQVVLFKVKDRDFATDIQKVRDIIRVKDITPVHNAKNFIKGVINLRGKIIVVADLGVKFGMGPVEVKKASRIVIVEVEEDQVGLLVDSVSEVIRIKKADIQKRPSSIDSQLDQRYMEGVKIMGEKILIIMNTDRLFSPADYHV
jgi:purine-binding chemotaxis protein CheW